MSKQKKTKSADRIVREMIQAITELGFEARFRSYGSSSADCVSAEIYLHRYASVDPYSPDRHVGSFMFWVDGPYTGEFISAQGVALDALKVVMPHEVSRFEALESAQRERPERVENIELARREIEARANKLERMDAPRDGGVR